MDELTAVTAFCREVLSLLEREAPAADFEQPVRAARSAGLSANLLADLDAAKLAALHVRAELEQRRRREAELAALFETASDLAALHDLDSVLRAIVRRARLLLGTDVAYMTLHDPAAGDTYMRITSGSVSAYFQQVRLGLGEGLGGLVARTRRAVRDRQLSHRRAVSAHCPDRPSRARGGPGGHPRRAAAARQVSDRGAFRRGPAYPDVRPGGGLAADALWPPMPRSPSTRPTCSRRPGRRWHELNIANEIVKDHSAAVERAAQAHHRFTELVLAGGKAENIAKAVSSVLGSAVLIFDEQDSLIAASTEPAGNDAALLGVLAEARAGRCAVCSGNLWAVPASAGSEHLGTVVLRAGPGLPETDRLILERAATVTALLLLLRRTVTEAEQQVRGDLLTDLLSTPHRDPESLRDRALRLGADLDKPHVVVAVRAEPALQVRLRPAALHVAATRHGLAASFEGNNVLLLPGDDPPVLLSDVAAALEAMAGHPVTVAADGTRSHGQGPAAVASAYLQACRCIEALHALGRRGAAATPEDLGFLGMLLADRKDVPGFVRAAIGDLIDYDARKGTELVRTVEAYFASGGNVTKTKDALHVHVNTVTQRLERVSQVLGEDWQLGQRALEIRIAVYLHRVGAECWAGSPHSRR